TAKVNSCALAQTRKSLKSSIEPPRLSQQLEASSCLKSFSQNSSPASVGFCPSTLAQTVLRKSRRKITQLPIAPPTHRCAWLRPLSADSESVSRGVEALRPGIEMRKTRCRIQPTRRESVPA